MKKIIHIDIDDVLNNTPEPKLTKYPLIHLYKERMRESIYGKFFGIMIPVYAIVMLFTIFLPSNLFTTSIMTITSIVYIISYLLLVNYEAKKKKMELIIKTWGSIDNYEEFKKVFNIFIFLVTFI